MTDEEIVQEALGLVSQVLMSGPQEALSRVLFYRDKIRQERVKEEIAHRKGVCIWCGEELAGFDAYCSKRDREYCRVALPPLSTDERRAAWRYYMGQLMPLSATFTADQRAKVADLALAAEEERFR